MFDEKLRGSALGQSAKSISIFCIALSSVINRSVGKGWGDGGDSAAITHCVGDRDRRCFDPSSSDQSTAGRHVALSQHNAVNQREYLAAVALSQISAYTTHKNLAVRKIMEAMRTAYAKSGTRSQHVSNYTRGKLSISFRWYTFPNFLRKFIVHLRTVYAFPKKLAQPLI